MPNRCQGYRYVPTASREYELDLFKSLEGSLRVTIKFRNPLTALLQDMNQVCIVNGVAPRA